MLPTTKFYFFWITDNGNKIHISKPYAFNDDEFYSNIEFVERFYDVHCKVFVTE